MRPGRSVIKGPGLKIRFDVRRDWECGQCGYRIKLPANRVALRCPQCGESVWLRLVEPQRVVKPYQVPLPTDIEFSDLELDEMEETVVAAPVEVPTTEEKVVEEAETVESVEQVESVPSETVSTADVEQTPTVVENSTTTENAEQTDETPRARKKRNRRRRRSKSSSTEETTEQNPPMATDETPPEQGGETKAGSSKPTDEGFGAGIL